MKKLITILLVLAFVGIARAAEYKIYDAGKPVVPKYVVKSRPDGSYAVYPSGKPLIPQYIVRPAPDGSYTIYEPRNPVVPQQRVNGQHGTAK